MPRIDNHKTKYTYRDILTGRLRYTRGAFSHWARGGPLGAWYAVFVLRRGALMVPEWCLTTETCRTIPTRPES